MVVKAGDVKTLREKTGGGVVECKNALEEANGNMAKAEEILKKKGQARAEKVKDRVSKEGRVGSYVHTTGKIGVLVDLACETDFVAKSDEFLALLKDLCLHVCACSPQYVSKANIPADVLEQETAKFAEEVKGKPPEIQKKILDGKLTKTLFTQKCLLEQPFVKDDTLTIGALIDAKVAKLRENIVVRRFQRFEIGE
ncbi:MAG: translation elongation factor Ts [Planctomycetota bacterium]|nr:translation elongation factor Ts [Planctomycetota bacterium]